MRHKRELDEFLGMVRHRLEVGERTYRDNSTDKPLTVLIEEVQAELEDVAGWASLAWARLQYIYNDLVRIEMGAREGNSGEQSEDLPDSVA